MVYGYKTNEEFIDKSYQLLEKLEAKGLWNKDTLVIGLDKSVRPLAYTLRKLSDLEGKEKPDMRFFNYSSRDESKKTNLKINKEKSQKLLNNYENILILDEYAFSGDSLRQVRDLVKEVKNDVKISFATLKAKPYSQIDKGKFSDTKLKLALGGKFDEADRLDKQFLEMNLPKEFMDLNKNNFTYIDDSYDLMKPSSSETGIQKSTERLTSVKDKETRQKFLTNRYQLSKDIKNYLHEKHPKKISKSGTLEKIISGVFIFSFLVGLVLSSPNLTGNAIGTSFSDGHKLLGIILILLGIGGFFVFRELRN